MVRIRHPAGVREALRGPRVDVTRARVEGGPKRVCPEREEAGEEAREVLEGVRGVPVGDVGDVEELPLGREVE